MSGRQLRISAWAIRNPTPVAVLFIGLVLAGLFAYQMLPVKNYPNVEFPVVSVTVTQNGAAPSELKTQVTRPIEDSLSGVTDVESMASTVTQGSSQTRVQFNIGTDMQKATDDVRAKVEAARAQQPREIDPPTVERVDIEDSPIITYSIEPRRPVSRFPTPTCRGWWTTTSPAPCRAWPAASPGVPQYRRRPTREVTVIADPVRMAAQASPRRRSIPP